MIWIVPILCLLIPALLSWPLGKWMDKFLSFRIPGLPKSWFMGPEQNWRQYIGSFLFFNGLKFAFGFLVLYVQPWMPLNPDHKGALDLSLIFHTTASFVTNTNMQHYSGEQALSYFSQIFFVLLMQLTSGAVGLAALAALARALGGRKTMGHFYADTARFLLFLFLPFSFVMALIYVASGMPMTFDGAAVAHTLEGVIQNIARGPVAAIIPIKLLGTNGGGFFGPNSAHPFENPTWITNILETTTLILIPMACLWLFGRLAKRMRHAAVLFAVLFVCLTASTVISFKTEQVSSPALAGLSAVPRNNLDGMELRFGPGAASTFAVFTTATSCGATNAQHDSLEPLTLLMALIGMWLNAIFGGVGVGFINLFLYIILTIFIAGMMVGRTPEYLAKKVEAPEVKLVLVAILAHPLLILGATALFTATSWGAAAVGNPGSRGFTEILYEFTSCAANNGSALGGLASANPPFNIIEGLVMLLARFIPIVAPLMAAGLLSAKTPTPETVGTFRTDTPLFGVLLVMVMLLVGALLFFPFAALGPVAEHLAAFAAH